MKAHDPLSPRQLAIKGKGKQVEEDPTLVGRDPEYTVPDDTSLAPRPLRLKAKKRRAGESSTLAETRPEESKRQSYYTPSSTRPARGKDWQTFYVDGRMSDDDDEDSSKHTLPDGLRPRHQPEPDGLVLFEPEHRPRRSYDPGRQDTTGRTFTPLALDVHRRVTSPVQDIISQAQEAPSTATRQPRVQSPPPIPPRSPEIQTPNPSTTVNVPTARYNPFNLPPPPPNWVQPPSAWSYTTASSIRERTRPSIRSRIRSSSVAGAIRRAFERNENPMPSADDKLAADRAKTHKKVVAKKLTKRPMSTQPILQTQGHQDLLQASASFRRRLFRRSTVDEVDVSGDGADGSRGRRRSSFPARKRFGLEAPTNMVMPWV